MPHVSLRTYIAGFVLSLLLTFTAYTFVQINATNAPHPFSTAFLIGLIVTLALIQFMVQAVFFLHLGTSEPHPRWRLMVFGFMLVVVAILVFGSLWIMTNLNSHMTPDQINQYLHSQDGI